MELVSTANDTNIHNVSSDIQICAVFETDDHDLRRHLMHYDKSDINADTLPRLYRILKINSDEIYTISIDGKNDTERPRSQPAELIYDSVKNGSLRLVTYDPIPPVMNPTDTMIEKRDELAEILGHIRLRDAVIEDKHKEYHCGVQYIHTTYGIDTKKIRRVMTAYWRKGMTVDAFFPEYRKRGRKAKVAESVEKINKASSPVNTADTPESDDIDEPDFEIEADDTDYIHFADIIDTRWAKTDNMTMKEAYKCFLKKYCTAGTDENGDLIFLSKNKVPSYNQFIYFARAYISASPEHYLRKRLSGTDFELKYRPVLGHSDSWCPGPGSVYAADASFLLDTELVDRETRTRNTGRCTTVILIDLYSRAIAGISCQFCHESYLSYLTALHCAATPDKEEYFKRLGVTTRNTDWPDAGIPAEIISDNGPMTSNLSSRMTQEYGITLINTLSHRGDMKGIVESWFHTMHLMLKAYIRGVVDAKKRSNGGKNNSYDACLTYPEFLQIVVDAVGVYNRTHRIHIPTEADLLTDPDVEMNPLSLWEHGRKYREYCLRRVDPFCLITRLLPVTTGQLSHNGLKVNGLYYSSEYARDNGTYIRKKDLALSEKKFGKIEVHYDPQLVDQVFEYNEKIKKIIIWQLTDYNGYMFYGKTQSEAKDILEKRKEQEKTQEKKSDSAISGLTERTEQAVDEAYKKTKKSVGKKNKLDINSKDETAEYEQMLLKADLMSAQYGIYDE